MTTYASCVRRLRRPGMCKQPDESWGLMCVGTPTFSLSFTYFIRSFLSFLLSPHLSHPLNFPSPSSSSSSFFPSFFPYTFCHCPFSVFSILLPLYLSLPFPVSVLISFFPSFSSLPTFPLFFSPLFLLHRFPSSSFTPFFSFSFSHLSLFVFSPLPVPHLFSACLHVACFMRARACLCCRNVLSQFDGSRDTFKRPRGVWRGVAGRGGARRVSALFLRPGTRVRRAYRGEGGDAPSAVLLYARLSRALASQTARSGGGWWCRYSRPSHSRGRFEWPPSAPPRLPSSLTLTVPIQLPSNLQSQDPTYTATAKNYASHFDYVPNG